MDGYYNSINWFFYSNYLVKEANLKDVLLFPVMYFGTSFVNISGSYLLAFILQKGGNEITGNPLYILASESTALIILAFWHYWRKEKLKGELIPNLWQYVILIVGLIGFSLIIAVAQLYEKQENMGTGQAKIFGGLMAFIAVLFMGLCFWQQFTFRKQKEFQIENEIYKNYLIMQERYVKMLISKDESLRRFRHDFRAHITALEAFAKIDDDLELQQYLKNMKENSEVFFVKNYTGVAAADAVISELYYRAQQENIQIDWEGTISLPEGIEIYDLCTMFSNFLLNAIEACEQMEEAERNIKVKVYTYDNILYINIKNQYHEVHDSRTRSYMETTKPNKRNHGIGSRNISDTVKKYRGSIEYIMKNGWFEVDIILNNPK